MSVKAGSLQVEMQAPQFEKLLNFRDAAKSINTKSSSTTLVNGLLFRSARPDETTAADRTALTAYYKIKTIIDLRTKTEHLNAAKKHQEISELARSSGIPVPESVVVLPIRIPEVHYTYINLNGKGFERSLVWQLSYWSLVKLVGLMTLGYRMEAIGILGREVLQQRGLTGLGIDTLEHSGPEIKQVFDVLACKDSWPVVVHCTQGKDRTGLIIALVLLLCHVDTQAITRDYILSEQELAAEKDERMKEISSIGLDESFAACPPEFVAQIQQHLDNRHGGIEAYLRGIGVTDEQQRQIKSALIDH